MEVSKNDIDEVCSVLGIDSETKRLTASLISQCGGSSRAPQQEDLSPSEADEIHRLDLCCYLFSSVKLRAKSAKNSPNGAILSHLLALLKISVADFLKELPIHVRLLIPALPSKYSDDPERKIEMRELQTSMVHSCLLSKKARDTFEQFFRLPVSSPILRVMWLLFLVAKARRLSRYPDLVSAFNMLLCVADFMLAHVQNAMAVIDFNDHTIFPVRTADGGPDTLASIAQVSNTSLTDTRPLAKKLNHLYQELFNHTGLLQSSSSFSFPDGQEMESRRGFSGLLAGDNINTVISLLDHAYEKALNETVEIDERPFIKQEAAEATAQRLSSGATPPTVSKCSLGTPTRPRPVPQTPVRLMRTPLRPPNHILRTPTGPHMGPGVFCVTPGPGVSTPISESMRLIAWLRESLKNISEEPSDKLKEIIESCGANASTIQENATRLAAVVFNSSPQRGQTAALDPRALEGVKLYYRVLESLLKDEAERLEKQKDRLYNLINNADFHKCLMACSFEMIIASYGMASLTFPAVLERMQIQAFDLCSIIESFARREPSLPKALQIHLFRMEEMIMESLAWEKGSSLYHKLYEACVPAALSRSDQESGNDSGPRSPPGSNDGAAGEWQRNTPVEKLVPTTIIQDRSQDEKSEGEKRNLEGDQEESPAKLQKGADESKVVPNHGGRDAREGEDLEGSTARKAPESPPKTPRRSLDQALATPERVPSTPLNPSKTSAFSAFMSPQRPAVADFGQSFPRLPLQFGDPKSSIGNKRARKLVAAFLSKVIRLGLHRASELCDRVDLAPYDTKQILKEVYTMLHNIVWEHTHLLYNRHLDQIVLCSLYAICKVHTMNNISFRELAAQYRKMPRTKIDTYRNVVVEQSEVDMNVERSGDIIVFYNSVFIPHTKSLVLNIGGGKIDFIDPPSNGLGAIRRVPMTPRAPPKQHQGLMTPPSSRRAPAASPLSGRIVISRQSPKKPFLSPKTKIFYAGRMGESAHAYQSPAKDLKYINSRIAVHSQSPVAIHVPPEPVVKAAANRSQNRSSEPSYSSARTSDDEPSATPSAPSGDLGSQLQGGFPGLSRLGGTTSSQNGPNFGHRPGGSGLESLHNAAMLLGSQEAARGGGSPGSATRRSRRQMGYGPGN